MQPFKTFPEYSPEETPEFFEHVDACLHTMYEDGVDPRQCVFVGEVAYDVNFRRTYVDLKQKEYRKAKSEAEGRVYIPRNKKELDELSPVLVCLIAASPKGILYNNIKSMKGPTDERTIRGFLQKLMSLMDVNDSIDNEWSIIFDHAQEETKKMISNLVSQRNYKAFFLPPCITTINPIDGLFSDFIAPRFDRKTINTKDPMDNCEQRIEKAMYRTTNAEVERCFKLYFECGCEDCFDRFHFQYAHFLYLQI